MPNPSLPISSADITALSYKILYDISGAVPTLTLTNLSTVINAANLKWWYIVTTPSGTPIHTGSLAQPDVNQVAWTTLNLPANSWPLLFGKAPCAQIEFSPSAPYICTLYVRDSAGNTYSLAIQQTITRPSGNGQGTCGNFGAAAVTVQVNCNEKNVFCADSTDVSYGSILTPSVQSNAWTLVYPPGPTGNQPANGTAPNTPYVTFPVGYSGEGYLLYLNNYCTYDMGNGASIKIQYKAMNPDTGAPGIPFAVLCNIDLCKLQCQIAAFYKMSKAKCGTLEDDALLDKMTRMNFLFNQAIIGILQPLCGIKVPEIIKEIQSIGELSDDCDCGCGDTGINFSYPTSSGGTGGGCCPVSSNVIDSETDVAPANCPGSYFPANVKDPTGVTDIGIAYDVNGLVAILNSYPAWQAYGVAFAQGNCKVGWFSANTGVVIPDVKVVIIPDVQGGGGNDGDGSGTGVNFQQDIYDRDTDSPPADCPNSFYPVNVYNYTNTTVIGMANNPVDLVSILNADASWNVFATYFVLGNCVVGSNLKNPNNIPTNRIKVKLIPVDNNGSEINKKIVTKGTSNYPPACPGSFYPAKVLNPAGTVIIGIVNNISEMVTLLNTTAAWSAYGVASQIDNCNVRWALTNPNNIPPDVQVDTDPDDTGCVGNSTMYTLKVTDICAGSVPSPADFPLNGYIDFGLGAGKVDLGVVADMAALIAAYNATPTKPASLTFSAGSPFGTIVVFNSSCTAYSGTILLTAETISLDFILYGANHRQMVASPPNTAKIQAIGAKTSTLIGKIAGFPPSGVADDIGVWHSIKIGKYLLVTSPASTAYQVRVYDITDPLMPVFYRSIDLPDTGGGTCFDGVPTTRTVASPSVAVASNYGLYFVTDNPEQMNIRQVYVVESITGSIWKLDIEAIGSAVVASFASVKLLGKCPRVIKNGKLFFTQDGDLEQEASLSSTIAKGFIPVLDLSDFTATGISSLAIYESVFVQEYIWAAAFDGLDTIWFITREGTVVEYRVSTNALITNYPNILPTANYRLNAKRHLNLLYATSLKFNAKTTGTVALMLDTFPGPMAYDFANFTPPGNTVPNNNSHYNILPLNNCLVAITYNNYADTGNPRGGVAIFTVNGIYQKAIQLAGGNIYNVIPFKPYKAPFTPTTLV